MAKIRDNLYGIADIGLVLNSEIGDTLTAERLRERHWTLDSAHSKQTKPRAGAWSHTGGMRGEARDRIS